MKVIVGLSGGVDSAVAAYLLIKQGYEVVGAFMRNWDSLANNDILGNSKFGEICPQEEDYLDAKAVADKLNIPLLRVDFIKEYWDNVFSYFVKEYQKGRTPNPDVLCNKYIKFSSFLDFAMKQGADYIATGHYARIKKINNEVQLLRGLDNNKDQSYFLALLNQKQLAKTLFPIGEMEKSGVRKIAKELGLIVADKKDSTGICFIGERNFRQFLSNYIPAQPGNIIDFKTKQIVGSHQGVMYYTLGQRRGLNIGGLKDHQGGSWFVIGKDCDKKELYVVQGDESEYLYSAKTIVNEVNWIGNPFEGIKELTCKYRYRQKDQKVIVRFLNESTIEVINLEKAKSTTPGQVCVFYDGEVCLGGGTIDEVIK